MGRSGDQGIQMLKNLLVQNDVSMVVQFQVINGAQLVATPTYVKHFDSPQLQEYDTCEKEETMKQLLREIEPLPAATGCIYADML